MSKSTYLHKTTLIFSFLLLFFCVSSIAHAQSFKKASITLSKNYPTPGTSIIATFIAPSLDMDTTFVTWRINGEVVEQGYSKSRMTFKAGGVGTFYNISVAAEDASGNRAYKETSFTVSDIAIVYEGVTYTHPFYRGRALPTQGSEIAFQAIAQVTSKNGTFIDSSDLFYAWYKNKSPAPFERGRGKDSVIVERGRPYEALEIELEVKDSNGDIRASKTMRVDGFSPVVMLYEKNPLAGILYDSAVGDTLGVYGGEATLVAEPYFMSANSRSDEALNYTWNIGEDKNFNTGTISLKPESGAGTLPLTLVIENENYHLQKVRKNVSIEFGTERWWENNENSI